MVTVNWVVFFLICSVSIFCHDFRSAHDEKIRLRLHDFRSAHGLGIVPGVGFKEDMSMMVMMAVSTVDDGEDGAAGQAGKVTAQNGMRKSIFCLSPAGDTPSSARLFDAIVSGCIPVIFSDELELPFEGILDYRKMVLFVSSNDAVQKGWLLSYLRSISRAQIRELQKNLAKYFRAR